MAVGIALSELVRQVRSQTGQSLSTAHGINDYESLKLQIASVQEQIYEEHNWPFLSVTRDKAVSINSNLIDYPTDMNPEGVRDIYFRTSTDQRWGEPLCYGIEQSDHDLYNSDAGETSVHVLKWDHHTDTNQVEIWPVPSVVGTLRFDGQRALGPFIADTDVCTLDGTMIVLFVAADILARQKAEDAPLKLQKAQRLKMKLLGRQGAQKRKPWVMGGGLWGGRLPRNPRFRVR